MCDVYDVLDASRNSARDMTSQLYDYGGGDLGNGIRRLYSESYYQGAIDIAPQACAVGYKQGYAEGDRDGVIKGVLITLGTSLTIVAVRKVNELIKRCKMKQDEKRNVTKLESKVTNNNELDKCQENSTNKS